MVIDDKVDESIEKDFTDGKSNAICKDVIVPAAVFLLADTSYLHYRDLIPDEVREVTDIVVTGMHLIGALGIWSKYDKNVRELKNQRNVAYIRKYLEQHKRRPNRFFAYQKIFRKL